MVDQACQEIRLQRTPGTFSYDCTQASGAVRYRCPDRDEDRYTFRHDCTQA